MREIPLLLIALFAAVLISGCTQTPANVASEVPGVLSNVSNGVGNAMGDIIAPKTTAIQPTFAPIRSDYVAPIPVQTTQSTPAPQDTIIGKWRLIGDNKPADCTAMVNTDNTGYLICTADMIQLADKDFTWYPITSTTGGVTDSYMINLSTGQDYTAQYSERNGWITSDVLPPGTELERV